MEQATIFSPKEKTFAHLYLKSEAYGAIVKAPCTYMKALLQDRYTAAHIALIPFP